MLENKKILTVCIPTFNRKMCLEKQLIFFQKQIAKSKKIQDQVQFIVSDNASTDDTKVIIDDFEKKDRFFDYYSNTTNLGLVGNIIASLNHSNTDYVWFVSDDDKLKDGIIELILDAICNNSPNFIFINYLSKSKPGYKGLGGLRTDSKNVALEIFNQSYGSLVFMTACVYKRKNLEELRNNKMFSWLSAPLLYSFYSCSKGPIYIIGEPAIIFTPDNASYAGLKRVLKLKFEEYLPILESLPGFGFDYSRVLKSIRFFFKNQSHSHFLYNFINPLNSFKLYKHYNISTFFAIPSNIIKYLFK